MESAEDEACEPFSSSRDAKAEALDHLSEKCWFFDNLLNRRERMLRCRSDPSPSSSFDQALLGENSHTASSASAKKLADDGVVRRGLVRAPSLPPYMGKKEEVQRKEGKSRINKLTRQLSDQILQQQPKPTSAEKERTPAKESNTRRTPKVAGKSSRGNLQRTQTLPSNMGREDTYQDKDSDARMSKLIREALACSTESLPPRQTSKAITQSPSVPKHQPPKSPDTQSSSTSSVKETRQRYLKKKTTRKSLSDLEFEELQGFKDLGFTFDKQELSPSVVNILPGLQDKKQEEVSPDKLRRTYLSEAWLAQGCAPPIPTWVVKDSAEDMKAQIKFWARAVATNVRQGC